MGNQGRMPQQPPARQDDFGTAGSMSMPEPAAQTTAPGFPPLNETEMAEYRTLSEQAEAMTLPAEGFTRLGELQTRARANNQIS